VIDPTPQIAAVPALVPFIGPEHLARKASIDADSLLRLGANESGFGPAPAVLEAIQAELSRVGLYGDPELFELRAALAKTNAVSPHAIVVASGIDELLGLVVRAYLAPGDTALMTRGSYPTFAFHIHGFGGRLIHADYRNQKPDLQALAQMAQRERPRMVYLANPDNPSGGFWPAEDIEAFLAAVPDTSLVLLDEAYAEYAPSLPATTHKTNVIRLRTFSKAYGLAGMRIGYALVAPESAALFEKIRLHFGVGRLSQVAALAALQSVDYMNMVIVETERGRQEYRAYGAELGLRTYPSATNFVLFEMDSVERAEQLVSQLLQRRVFIRKPGVGDLATSVRISVGTPAQRERLYPALREALAVVNSLGAA
jgi:histidinol-phosphate aminotransferase